jgi:hypothetical protein
MLAFVLGGGTADGNSDSVEVLDFEMRSRGTSSSSSSMSSAEDEAYVRIRAIDDHDGWRWRTMEGRLSSPRHAFGATSCTAVVRGTNDVDDVGTTSASIYAVGGWKHGAVSCDSVERLIVRYSRSDAGVGEGGGAGPPSMMRECEAGWETRAPLLIPRRLHAVVATIDGTLIYVLGGYVDERRTTSSIERYDVRADAWIAVDELPFGEDGRCSLVQAVADADGGMLIFPFGTDGAGGGDPPSVLRYAGNRSSLLALL